MNVLYQILLSLILTLGPVFGDVISGVVVDLDAGTPIVGVKVSVNASISTLTGAAGTFSLNTAPSAISLPEKESDRAKGWRWEGRAGAFPWHVGTYPGEGFHIRNVLGSKIHNRSWDAPIAMSPLAKASALNILNFEKTDYLSATRQVEGSQSGLSVQLKKALASRKANLTWFESYPAPGSEECLQYNGCTWAGQFAALSGKQPESWVKANNICAVHEKDFAKYRLKTLRLVQGAKTIDVKVYDMCSDADCDGCCTRNAGSLGFLIDVEKYTAERFGTRDGVVDWTCIDCAN